MFRAELADLGRYCFTHSSPRLLVDHTKIQTSLDLFSQKTRFKLTFLLYMTEPSFGAIIYCAIGNTIKNPYTQSAISFFS